MTQLSPDSAALPIVFIDDAHTFGGAQVALAWAIRVILRNTPQRIICVCTARTKKAIQEIAGEDARLEFVECPGALPLNAVSFPLRFLPFLRIVLRLRRKGAQAWWLSLSSIEFCLAPLCVLRALGENPHSWLHNAERASFFARRASWTRRTLSRLRDVLADGLLFRLHRSIITPSRSTVSELEARLGRSKWPRLGHLYCPTIRAQSTSTTGLDDSDNSPSGELIDLWMIGRVQYGHKNNPAALETVRVLLDAGKKVTLTVVGDGPDLENFKSRASTLGIAGAIAFLGWKTDPWQTVPKHAIVLIPSFYETMCLVAMEAMIRGIRLVGSPIPVFHEWIPPCLIADDFSAQAFAGKILDVQSLNKEDLLAMYAASLMKFSDALFVESFMAYTNGKA